MELLATLGGSLVFGVGGAWLSREAEARRKLHAWLWTPAAMWLVMLLWAWGTADVEPDQRGWAVLGLNVGFLAVALASLIALARTVTGRTWWYVIPYLVVTGLGAAYTWLLGYMGIQDVWF